jgi:DNA modification methylase
MTEPVILSNGQTTATLYLGDCLEILPTLGKVDSVVTDPPYGIAYRGGRGGKFRSIGVLGDESTKTRDEMLALVGDVSAIVFGSWKQPQPLNTRHVLIWEKGDHVGMGDTALPWRPNTEEIYIIGSGFSGHRSSSVLRVNAPSPNFTPPERRFHPTEKPVGLMQELVSKCNSDTILDPFMGSGTTGVACAKLGRNFIGIEIDPGYFDIAVKRIKATLAQPLLFGDVACTR